MNASNWKTHLYQSYVSSGQARESNTSATEHFRAPRAHLTTIIRRHFPADRSLSIVDVGCGQGSLLFFLSEAGYKNLQGVDASVEQVERAHRLGVPGVNCGDAMAFLRGLQDLSVGVVCMFDILEHLTRAEAFEMAHEVWRVLLPGGRCIGHVPNAEGIFGMRIRYGDLTHEQAFTKKSAGQMFRSLGFSDLKCFEDKPVVHGLKSMARRAIWEVGTLPFRMLLAAETGTGGFILSQNFLFVAHK